MWNRSELIDILKLAGLLIKDFMPSSNRKTTNRLRQDCNTSRLIVGIHEWGGYDLIREKNVRLIHPFTCGLQYQLERFADYKGEKDVQVIVTMSDADLHKNLDYVRGKCSKLIETTNIGMDFAGYSTVYNLIKDKENSFVLLTNSSVNAAKSDFIDDYINYMIENPDVGILGISYNSKCYQTLIKNNFTPHLQSFFLLTTTDVLNQIVSYNKGDFPGKGICNKQLLIREGEIKMSQIALALGYSLAVVQEDAVYKFNNDLSNWVLKKGDCRINCSAPNMIWPINKEL